MLLQLRLICPLISFALVLSVLAVAVQAQQAEPAPVERSLEGIEGLLRVGRAPEAETLARELHAEAVAADGEGSAEALALFDKVVAALVEQGRFQEPETLALAERALAMRREHAPDDVSALAVTLEQLGYLHGLRGDPALARQMIEKALGLQLQVHGPEHEEVAWTANSLADALMSLGELEESLAYRNQALEGISAHYGPDHPDVAYLLSMQSGALSALGDHQAAVVALERARDIQLATTGPEHLDHAHTLARLGGLHYEMGDFEAAIPLIEQSVELRTQIMGRAHYMTLASLGNLATTLAELGDLSAARPLAQEALDHARTNGSSGRRVAVHAHALSSILKDLGDLEAAERLQEESVKIFREQLGPDDPKLVIPLHALADLYRLRGELDGALALQEEAIARAVRTLGEDHATVGRGLASLAAVHRSAGRQEQARTLLDRALETLAKALGDEHATVAFQLQQLARHLVQDGDHEEAERLLQRSLRIQRAALGPQHPSVAAGLLVLAELRLDTGRRAEALQLALEAEAISRQHLRFVALGSAEREALLLSQSRSQGLNLALTALLSGESSADSVAEAWDGVVRSRAVVLDAMAARRRAASASPELRPLHETLGSAAQQLARLTARGPSDGRVDEHQELLKRAQERFEKAERELGLAGAAAGLQLAEGDVGWSEVRSALREGEALVSFVRFRRDGSAARNEIGASSADEQYLAFVLPPGADAPRAVSLGAAEAIDASIRSWTDDVSRPLGDPARAARRLETLRGAGAELRERVWDPIAPLLGEASRVNLVADAGLLQVNLATLPARGGGWLLESGPTFHHLSTERDLAAERFHARSGFKGLLAVGDPAYSASPWAEEGPGWMSRLRLGAELVASLAPLRGQTSGCPRFETLDFAPLSEAEREARELSRTWKRLSARSAFARDSRVLSGADATEEAFKALAPSHRVLHVATHGFFLEEDCSAVAEGTRGVTLQQGSEPVPAGPSVENPLLRSGLAFAGFNRRSEAPADADDGVLTAQEISALDLSAVEWAVLSACDTGRGDIARGEGVLGLQRAFRIAGARTLVMSLWQVDDRWTREWMESLYRSRLELGLDAADCAREASLHVLRQRRKAGLPEHPLYWGAFVVSGAPG